MVTLEMEINGKAITVGYEVIKGSLVINFTHIKDGEFTPPEQELVKAICWDDYNRKTRGINLN